MSTSVLATIVALVLLAIAALIGAGLVGLDEKTTPVLTTIIGLIALAITQLLALVKAERTESKVDQIQETIENGEVNRGDRR